jgi:hypothetical protein
VGQDLQAAAPAESVGGQQQQLAEKGPLAYQQALSAGRFTTTGPPVRTGRGARRLPGSGLREGRGPVLRSAGQPDPGLRRAGRTASAVATADLHGYARSGLAQLSTSIQNFRRPLNRLYSFGFAQLIILWKDLDRT